MNRRQISACACAAAAAASAAEVFCGSNAALAVAANVVRRKARRFIAGSLEMLAEKLLHDGEPFRIVEFLPAVDAAGHDHELNRASGFPVRGVQFARLLDGHLRI